MDGSVNYVYRRAADELARRIKAGEWAYGEKLPDRAGLAAMLGVGEMTARRVTRMLADPGRPGGPLVRILPGAGVYVTWRPE